MKFYFFNSKPTERRRNVNTQCLHQFIIDGQKTNMAVSLTCAPDPSFRINPILTTIHHKSTEFIGVHNHC